ncbi:MAG TPA: enoyl-CoA hydratase/isomerase family protein [Acidimicrobiia bacterium]|nr:enoyl-CoA hydratase/isomerase family protein [Acidimicrobiia bacterium]
MLKEETHNYVCRLTFNRPEKLNALDEELRGRLVDVVHRLRDDPSIRVVVLAGEGRAFSAGYDIASSRFDGTWEDRRHQAGAWQRLLEDVEALPQVTVARLHGSVIGGAALLAVACDLRVAGHDVRISIPELALGIPLTWAGLPRLVREIGLPGARDLVMTGRVVIGEEALRLGLVQRVVKRDLLDTAVDDLVGSLLETPSVPLSMTKAAFRALGQAIAGNHLAWADPDILESIWKRPETAEAARRYLDEKRQRRLF